MRKLSPNQNTPVKHADQSEAMKSGRGPTRDCTTLIPQPNTIKGNTYKMGP